MTACTWLSDQVNICMVYTRNSRRHNVWGPTAGEMSCAKSGLEVTDEMVSLLYYIESMVKYQNFLAVILHMYYTGCFTAEELIEDSLLYSMCLEYFIVRIGLFLP